jgi:hypothetical protein
MTIDNEGLSYEKIPHGKYVSVESEVSRLDRAPLPLRVTCRHPFRSVMHHMYILKGQ